MLKLSLCDYSDAYILVSGSITVVGAGTNDTTIIEKRNNKREIFTNCVRFTDCITETNNTQVDNAKDLHVVMPIYNLIENSDNFQKHLEVYINFTDMSQMI